MPQAGVGSARGAALLLAGRSWMPLIFYDMFVADRDSFEFGILSAPVRDVEQPDDASWVYKYLGVARAACLSCENTHSGNNC